jgi:hypothetical protein
MTMRITALDHANSQLGGRQKALGFTRLEDVTHHPERFTRHRRPGETLKTRSITALERVRRQAMFIRDLSTPNTSSILTTMHTHHSTLTTIRKTPSTTSTPRTLLTTLPNTFTTHTLTRHLSRTRNRWWITTTSSASRATLLKKVHKAKVNKTHPDKGGKADEGPTAGELTDAKNALLDPVQRKELDEELDRELNARGEYGYGSMWQDVAGGVK